MPALQSTRPRRNALSTVDTVPSLRDAASELGNERQAKAELAEEHEKMLAPARAELERRRAEIYAESEAIRP